MDDRYEIRAKVGQGGIGSVHRAYDHKLKREVAIKRILTSEDDPDLAEEATKQMIAEARALASLQHPHIVTILDVGTDEEGPYVVMELLTGNTLDELIEKSPLTWEDCKEVITQSLEALIAAQELGMIHSDLKPPNIMLTWLPSGKFQVKILDFGLAVLIQSQSQEEIENMESVFGSIFFMPPEQFERQTLDERSDLYSLGCCFYQALAGNYPFTGNNGEEVMEAHLNHTVIAIEEARDDMPEWACQWIMWLINRERDDRPATARDALANFLENIRLEEQAKNRPRGPKRLVPSSETSAVSTATSAQATAATSAVELPDGEEGSAEQVADDTDKPSILRSPRFIKATAVAALLLLFCGIGWFLKQRVDRSQGIKAYNSLLTKAANDGVTQILMSEKKLKLVLRGLAAQGADADLDAASEALLKIDAQDEGNTELIFTQFATSAEMPDRVREILFSEVISMRDPEGCTTLLLEYTKKEDSPELATAALGAARGLVEDKHAPILLEILSSRGEQAVVEETSKLMREIISWSKSKGKLASQIEASLERAGSDTSKQALRELLQSARGGSQ